MKKTSSVLLILTVFALHACSGTDATPLSTVTPMHLLTSTVTPNAPTTLPATPSMTPNAPTIIPTDNTPENNVLILNIPIPTQKPASEFGWTIIFQYEFDEYYWQLGTNSYQIFSDCPDVSFLGDINGQRVSFEIDTSYRYLYDPYVELLYFNPSVHWDGYSLIFHIRPEQKTRLAFGYENLSIEQATLAARDCRVHALINDKLDLELHSMEITTEHWVGAYHRP